MHRLSLKAILIGGVTDVVTSFLLGIPIAVYVLTQVGIAGGRSGSRELVNLIHAYPRLYAFQLAIGIGCSVLGGYVAARIARHDERLNGVLASWLCVGLGIYGLAGNLHMESPTIQAALIAITPLCYLAGAELRIRLAQSAPRAKPGV